MTGPEIKQNLSHGYYNHVQPETMVSQGIIPPSRVDDAKFEFAELELDGSNYLIILCPTTVGGGPGRKLVARDKNEKK